MSNIERCRYCGADYLSNGKGEHVFPHGLGGQNLYLRCVCDECNGYFSRLERELYQSSVVGLMRSVEGVQGYKKYEHLAPFKAQILLMPGKNNEIIYEVGQYYKMQVFVRPQIIAKDDKFYLESSSEAGPTKLVGRFRKWRKDNLRMIIKMPSSKEGEVEYIEFHRHKDSFVANTKKDRLKIRGEIFLDLLPESHNLYSLLTPRLFIDDENNLRVRAATLDQGVKFLCSFLTATLGQLILNSFGEEVIHQPVISVGYSFDSFKSEQALVKIGINCLINYFPQIKQEKCLDDSISFVMNGKPLIHREVEEHKSCIIDSCKNAHTIFFYQGEETVKIRISLFDGGFIFAFYVPQLKILRTGGYNRLVIRYLERVNKFENQEAFFRSFASEPI